MSERWSRRAFLGLLASGAVGACVVARVSTTWLPEPVRRLAACEFMNRCVNAWLASQHRSYPSMPEELRAGRALYEAFESEITVNRRFASAFNTPHGDMSTALAFKGVALFEHGDGWDFTLIGSPDWESGGNRAVRVDFVTGRSTGFTWNPVTKRAMELEADV